MNYHNRSLPKKATAYLSFILTLTIFIVQVYANEIKQAPSSSMTPIIPALTDLDGDTNILSKEFYPINMDDFRLHVPMPQQSQSIDSQLPKGMNALVPFAPIGHFESVFIPDLYELEVGGSSAIAVIAPHMGVW